MLINISEVKEMSEKHLPSIARKHPGIKLLIGFVGKTVNAVNGLDKRLRVVEAKLNITPEAQEPAPEIKDV